MKRLLVVAAVVFVTAACQVPVVGGPPSYSVSAEFPSTIGLYPGSFVRQLGINVGSVTNVATKGDHVLVTMKIRKSVQLSPSANAILVGNSVLGERYVQFEPAYTGGPAMAAGTTLSESRVTVPVETDTVLRSLGTVLNGINPTDISRFTTNLADILRGEGQKLNSLIGNAAGTIDLLAQKSQDLGQLTTTLAQLSSQLGTRDQALAALVKDYDLLSQTLATDRGQLDGVITQLTNVTTQATGLLVPNLQPIKNDVAGLTTVAQTLDRNIQAVDIGLAYAPRLFAAAQNSYDPQHNWLPLNSQSSPSETSEILAGNIRDALASICRRLAAKNPALAPAMAACSDPASSFFNPIVGLIPQVVNSLPGAGPVNPQPGPATAKTASVVAPTPAAPPDATTAFTRGLAAIPGLSDGERHQLAAQALSPPTSTAPSGPPGAAAIDALASTPRGSVPASATDLGPAPVLRAAPSHHHHHGLWGWLEGLL